MNEVISKNEWIRRLIGGLVGFAVGISLVVLAFFMAGAGHGWTTPGWPSFACLFFFPVLGVVSGMQPTKSRLALLKCLVVVAVVGDLLLIIGTMAEVPEYFGRVMRLDVPIGPAWLLIWSGAQALAVYLVGMTLARMETTSDVDRRRRLIWIGVWILSAGAVAGLISVMFLSLVSR